MMWLGFQFVFLLSAYPTDLIDSAVALAQTSLHNMFGEGAVTSLFIDGVLGGVGATLLFLPQVFMLFLFLEMLRESGFFAFGGNALGRILNKVGLSTQSATALLMGFGCNVPAIMSVRRLETERERIITAMMIPFMSCSARLPVFTLFVSAFFPLAWQGSVLFGLYGLGILFAIITGLVLNFCLPDKKLKQRKTKGKLRWPNMKRVGKQLWHAIKHFLIKVGRIIIPLSFLMWFLFAFPQAPEGENQINQSYAAQVGKTFEPIFDPLGFSWQINTALVAGIAAKEGSISILGTLYSLDENIEQETLRNVIRQKSGLTMASALALMVFVLLYLPCVGVVAALRHELGYFWAIVGIVYPTVLAWVMAFATYRVFLGLGV
jgi:ferrous iron transport protein B